MDFDAAISIASLEEAYDRLRDGHRDVFEDTVKIPSGSDRIQLPHFDRDRSKHFRAAERKLREGRYTFAPMVEHEIPKDSRTTRTISIAAIRDLIVQRVVYDYLYDHIDSQLCSSVFGYRRGHNAHQAINQIRAHFAGGRSYVYDADLASFFDTVNHDLLLEKLEALRIDDRAKTLVRRFLKTRRVIPQAGHEPRRNRYNQKLTTVPRTIGVPQGGVLSGILTNLFLAEFDRDVEEEFGGLVRYADDFVICLESEEECRRAASHVESALRSLRVELNQEKTNLCRRAPDGVDFVGFTVTDTLVRVRQRNVERFKSRIDAVIAGHRTRATPLSALRSLCYRINFKIQGPGLDVMQRQMALGRVDHPYRRSWIGFFRTVTDEEQIRDLDRWIASRISRYMWDRHEHRTTRTAMRKAGLKTLINTMWKARRRP